MSRKAPTPESSYTLRGIQEMLGLSRGVVAGLVASGYVSPGRGPRNEYRFSFQDVILLRTAVELQAASIAPRRILSALRKLRTTLPDELPLKGLRLTAVGNDVTVRDGRSQWQAESGQLVMDFDVAPVKGTVAFLPHAAARARHAAPPSLVAPPARSAAADAAEAFVLGEAIESHDRSAAEVAYRQALALDPEHADAYLNLGALLCETQRCKEAVALYDEALRRRPDEALLHFNRAVALEDQNRPMEALADYNAALQLEPELADAHYNAARLHEQLGDAKKALRHLSAYRRLERRR